MTPYPQTPFSPSTLYLKTIFGTTPPQSAYLPSVTNDETANIHPRHYTLHHERLGHEEIREKLRGDLKHVQHTDLTRKFSEAHTTVDEPDSNVA